MIGHPQGERLMTWVDQGVEEAELKDGDEDEDHAHLNITSCHQSSLKSKTMQLFMFLFPPIIIIRR